jgi:hypothetical protein
MSVIVREARFKTCSVVDNPSALQEDCRVWTRVAVLGGDVTHAV